MSDKKRTSKDADNSVTLAVPQEAVNLVWERFETALEKLDPASMEIFEQFLGGTPVETLGAERELTIAQTQAWLGRIKRQVVTHLRSTCKVRH